MTDDSTVPPERSWSPETGWPSADIPPSWADPDVHAEASEEDEYDAWLDAQAGPEPDEAEEPAAEVVTGSRPEDADDRVPDPDESAAPVEQAGQEVEEAGQEVEEAPGAEAGPPGVPVTRSATPFVASLVALVVALAGLTGFLGWRAHDTSGGGSVEAARHNGLAAARNATRLVFSYDYRHLDKDFAAGKAVTTGTFAGDYARTTSKLVDDVAARYKAVVVADVSDAAVISASDNRVVTLVFLNQRSTSSLAAGEKITQSRITMVLVRKGGSWLVAEVKAF
jgi:Mce-associated membrane protein